MSMLIRSVAAAAVVVCAVPLGSAATAVADDSPPNCTAADLASVMAGVSTATAEYLFTHPDVNTYLTTLKDHPKEQRRELIQSYLEANPAVKADFQGIRQPSVDFHDRCGVD